MIRTDCNSVYAQFICLQNLVYNLTVAETEFNGQYKERGGKERYYVTRHALSHQLDRFGFGLGAIQDVLKHGDRSTTEVYIQRMRARRFDEELISALERTLA
ncbi:MAG: hypothetical protein IH853_10735 [Bacteroidetes bacterium]|nr:hypothetical protein [Bacteroidota bacterium]